MRGYDSIPCGEINSGCLAVVAVLSGLRAGGHMPPEMADRLDSTVMFQKGLDEIRRLGTAGVFDGPDGDAARELQVWLDCIADLSGAAGPGPYEAVSQEDQSVRGREVIRQSALVDHGMVHNMQAACQFAMADRFAESAREKQEYLASVGIDISGDISAYDAEAEARLEEYYKAGPPSLCEASL